MPYKNIEKRRANQKAWKRRKRAKIKEHKEELRSKEIDAHFRSGDINFGIKTQKPKFMSYREWKIENSEGSFKDYLKLKREFDFENRDYGEPLRTPSVLSASEKAYAEGIGLRSNNICVKLREQLRHATPKQAIFIKMLLDDNGCSY